MPDLQSFEAVTGSQVREAIADGRAKVDYHMVAFLDPFLYDELLEPGAERRRWPCSAPPARTPS